MNIAVKSSIIVFIGLVIGICSSLLFGAAPSNVSADVSADGEWGPAWSPPLMLQAVDAQWDTLSPWGKLPVPAAAESAQPLALPPAVPVGVVRDGKRHVAIFQVNGNGVMRASTGDALPDGARVLQVGAGRIVWLDAKGKRQQRDIFNNFQGGR